MKNKFLIILITLSVFSCKKEQVYSDSLGNIINVETQKNDIRYKIQGTYALNCFFSFLGENGSYDAKISMSPNKDKYVISPLRLSKNAGTMSEGDFVISINSQGLISFNNINNFIDYTANGSGTINTVSKEIQFNLITTDQRYKCNCTGKKK
jgi:hypothetical protein